MSALLEQLAPRLDSGKHETRLAPPCSWPLPNNSKAAFFLDTTNSLFIADFRRPQAGAAAAARLLSRTACLLALPAHLPPRSSQPACCYAL